MKQTEKVLQDKKVRAGSFQKTYTAKYYGTFKDASTPYKVIHDNKPFFTKTNGKQAGEAIRRWGAPAGPAAGVGGLCERLGSRRSGGLAEDPGGG